MYFALIFTYTDSNNSDSLCPRHWLYLAQAKSINALYQEAAGHMTNITHFVQMGSIPGA